MVEGVAEVISGPALFRISCSVAFRILPDLDLDDSRTDRLDHVGQRAASRRELAGVHRSHRRRPAERAGAVGLIDSLYARCPSEGARRGTRKSDRNKRFLTA